MMLHTGLSLQILSLPCDIQPMVVIPEYDSRPGRNLGLLESDPPDYQSVLKQESQNFIIVALNDIVDKNLTHARTINNVAICVDVNVLAMCGIKICQN